MLLHPPRRYASDFVAPAGFNAWAHTWTQDLIQIEIDLFKLLLLEFELAVIKSGCSSDKQ